MKYFFALRNSSLIQIVARKKVPQRSNEYLSNALILNLSARPLRKRLKFPRRALEARRAAARVQRPWTSPSFWRRGRRMSWSSRRRGTSSAVSSSRRRSWSSMRRAQQRWAWLAAPFLQATDAFPWNKHLVPRCPIWSVWYSSLGGAIPDSSWAVEIKRHEQAVYRSTCSLLDVRFLSTTSSRRSAAKLGRRCREVNLASTPHPAVSIMCERGLACCLSCKFH